MATCLLNTSCFSETALFSDCNNSGTAAKNRTIQLGAFFESNPSHINLQFKAPLIPSCSSVQVVIAQLSNSSLFASE